MKIAIVSKADKSGGGASKVAQQLVAELRQTNIYVEHFTRNKYMGTISLYTNREKYIYHRLLSIGIQEYFPFERKIIKKYDLFHHYDIFHFHDLTTAVSPLTLKYLSKHNKTIIWTIHDCSVVTGGCINPLECVKYLHTCTGCPQLGDFGLAKNIDLTFLFHMIKKKVLKESNIHFVAPSKWIADFVYKTGYIKKYPTIIPNGVDTKKFIPYNKQQVRQELHLPLHRFVILLSSANLNSSFKGITEAIEIIFQLKKLNPVVVLIGKKSSQAKQMLHETDVYETGYISDEAMLNKYYSSADIYLNTTKADNFPLTVLEVMASGTPNVGYPTGGIPEMISQKHDGILGDKNQLVKIIHQYTNELRWGELGKNARKKVLKEYQLSHCSKQYLDFYLDTIAIN